MSLTIVLLRHATRSAVLDFGQTESALNPIGLKQAQDLIHVVAPQGKLPQATALITSPKLRARQTLKPLSDQLKIEASIMDDLDERRDSEGLSKFENRVRGVCETVKSTMTGVVYLCTHLDVLEAAAALWPTDFSEREAAQSWSTLEYQVFELNNGVLHAGLRGRVDPR